MKRVLLFNVNDAEKRAKILLAASRLGLRCAVIAPEVFSQPLGFLLGEPGFLPSPGTSASFEEEMLVMEELSPPLLEALRAMHAPVALKAVVTEHNRAWSPAQLCGELRKEREALRRAAAGNAANRHPHRRRK